MKHKQGLEIFTTDKINYILYDLLLLYYNNHYGQRNYEGWEI